MIKITIKIVFIILPTLWIRGADVSSSLNQSVEELSPVVGSFLTLKIDFDVYRVEVGSRKAPTYFYEILPSSETGIGGWEIAYLGQIPSGSRLQIVDIKKGKWSEGISYWVKVLLPNDQLLKKSPRWEADVFEEKIYSQIFKLRRTASKDGAYIKGRYPNGNPRLNEKWLVVVGESGVK